MSLPSLPTDDFYKFFAVSGIVLLIASAYFSGRLFWDHITQVHQLQDEIELMQYDLKAAATGRYEGQPRSRDELTLLLKRARSRSTPAQTSRGCRSSPWWLSLCLR